MKKQPPSLRFSNTPTSRLALSYLALIMIMSLGFSFVFYKTSSHELGRHIPPPSFFNSITRQSDVLDSQQFFQQRIAEGRSSLLNHLVLLNLSALVLGSFLSYYLARRTLLPIEEAMEAQNRFVSDASHELKTPLTAIQTSNEVALRKAGLTLAGAKAVIKSNIEETAKLTALSNGLLSLATQSGKQLSLQPVSLQAVASEAMGQVVHPAQAKHIVVHDAVPAAIQVQANLPALAQLVVILLDNAIKYSDPKGSIYLEGFTEGNHGYLVVRDEGHGIKASDLPHIFDRFYRADRSRSKDQNQGYGLGLAIAQTIIEQHHGEIIAQSAPQQGSIFTIKLRLAAP